MSSSIRDRLGFQAGTGLHPWHRSAACAGFPLSRFFEELGSDQKRRDTGDAKAKRVCSRCPVRRDCLVEALDFEQGRFEMIDGKKKWLRHNPVGTYGGQGERERWAHDVTHLDSCASRSKCKGGCRPIPERVEMLEARLRDQAESFLVPGESIV